MNTVENNISAIVMDKLNEEKPMVVDVLIVGAGIGGLVAALCLHRAGFSVQVREQTSILEPIGFGLNLQPYCVKLLYELGLEHELDKTGIPLNKAVFYSRSGQFIYEEPRGIDAGFSWPLYSMHRGHFQQLLLRHVRAKLGESSVQLNQKLIAFRSQANHVEVDFVNPVTGCLTTELAKVLVGAEGINSTVRKILYSNEGLPLWTGLTVWRGVTQMDEIYLNGKTMIYMGNPNELVLVIHPVSNNLVNWNVVVRVAGPEVRASPMTFDWNNRGYVQDLLPLLSNMKLDFLDIHHLINSSTTINQFVVSDRDILPQWTHDRVTLLGDAAHPMYPTGGNGASQAILDARGLILSFREHGATPQGLKAYEDRRRQAAHTVVLSAREYGPLKILQIIDERSPLGFRQLSDVISPSELEDILADQRQRSGWNSQKLNQEPPLF